jgi:hypothetical protein
MARFAKWALSNCPRDWQFARRQFGFEIPIGSLERLFKCSPAAVKQRLKNRPEPPRLRSRQNALADDPDAEFLA